MPMPETAMHKDYLPPAREHKVWLSRQVRLVQPIPVTHAVDDLPNAHFGLRILVLDTPHPFASFNPG